MEVVFLNSDYGDLYYGRKTLGFSNDLIKSYQKKLQFIRGSVNITRLYAQTSFHLEKLKGDKEGFMSIRLNKQWRLIIKVLEEGQCQVIGVKGIEDYH